ncbi:hypothetical protein C8R44DRAFT_811786 [Mycena epipterygia]|nr:hypothetical protein C8R44DRAFT_811786 [Mycena epipterygia]
MPSASSSEVRTSPSQRRISPEVNAISRQKRMVRASHPSSLLATPSEQRGLGIIGLGHPSTSKRRNLPPQPEPVASPPASEPQSQAQPAPIPRRQPRINSSTIKPRTKRFAGRALFSIPEEAGSPAHQQHPAPPSVPRKRSYAAAASALEICIQVTPAYPNRRASLPTAVYSSKEVVLTARRGRGRMVERKEEEKSSIVSKEECAEEIDLTREQEQRVTREMVLVKETLGAVEMGGARVAARRKVNTSKWQTTLF